MVTRIEQCDELYRIVRFNTAEQKVKADVSLLRGKALATYLSHRFRVESEQNELGTESESSEVIIDADAILARSLDKLVRLFFPTKYAYRRQVAYIHYRLSTMVRQDDMRLYQMNYYLLYFPTINKQDDCSWKQYQVLVGEEQL
jgi:hypothetical protein